MKSFKNLPEEPVRLASLIAHDPEKICMRELSAKEGTSIRLCAMGSEQGRKNIAPVTDVLYYIIDGEMILYSDEGEFLLGPGDVLALQAGTIHGIEGRSPVKFMAIE